MSIRKDRLQLIRERHRKLILAPRERFQVEALQDDWDDFECFEDEGEDVLDRLELTDDDEE